MTKPKAEEYMRGMIQRMRKRFTYDPNTGAINAANNILAMTEDLWFPKTGEGSGVTVDTLPAGQNLGEVADVLYFLKKLYKVLKIPRSRWDDQQNTYSAGKTDSITREEIHFANFVGRLQNRFKYFIADPFFTQLKLKGIDRKYINYKLLNISFTKNNLFKEYKEQEILDTRLSSFNTVSSLLWSKDNENGVIHPDWALRNVLKLTEEEIRENKDLIGRAKLGGKLAELEGGGAPSEAGEVPPGEGEGLGGAEAGPEGEAAPEGEKTATEKIAEMVAANQPEAGPEVAPESEFSWWGSWKNLEKQIDRKYQSKLIT